MRGWIGVTDNEWFSFLSRHPGIDEVNFRQPGEGLYSRLFGSGSLSSSNSVHLSTSSSVKDDSIRSPMYTFRPWAVLCNFLECVAMGEMC